MKAITGEVYKTSMGEVAVFNEQNTLLEVGETVLFNGNQVEVKQVIAPSRPNGVWSFAL